MSRTPCPCPTPTPAAPLGPQLLAALVEVVDRGLDLRRSDRARLVRIRTAPAGGLDGDEIEVGFRPFEAGRHPLDDLVGFDAPDDWAAIGLAATGLAARAGGGPPDPVCSVQLVDRSGAWAGSYRVLPEGDADDAPADVVSCSSATDPEPPTGRVDDALRRAIDVATAPPPPGGTLLLWAVLWLDTVLATVAASASRRKRRRSIPALLGAHPAVAVLGLDPGALDADRLVAEGRKLAAWRDWSQLRRACATTAWSTPDLDPAVAAWLDDGSFARWLLGTRPDLDELHEALASLLVPSALAVVDDVLAGWNLLPEHGPPVPEPDGPGQ